MKHHAGEHVAAGHGPVRGPHGAHGQDAARRPRRTPVGFGSRLRQSVLGAGYRAAGFKDLRRWPPESRHKRARHLQRKGTEATRAGKSGSFAWRFKSNMLCRAPRGGSGCESQDGAHGLEGPQHLWHGCPCSYARVTQRVHSHAAGLDGPAGSPWSVRAFSVCGGEPRGGEGRLARRLHRS